MQRKKLSLATVFLFAVLAFILVVSGCGAAATATPAPVATEAPVATVAPVATEAPTTAPAATAAPSASLNTSNIGLPPDAYSQAQHPSCEGVELVVASLTGPAVSSPHVKYRDQWNKITGGTVKVIEFAYGDIFEKYRTAFASGTHIADIINYSSGLMAADIMGGGWVLPVPEKYKAMLDWDDILPAVQGLIQWNGTQYALPYDGDMHQLYYRTDLFDDPQEQAGFKAKYGYDLAPPKTWEEYGQMAEWFNRPDKQLYGHMEPIKQGGGMGYLFITRSAPYVKMPDDPSPFFDPTNMNARVGNEGYVKALEDWVASLPTAPPDYLTYDFGKERPEFTGGHAALTDEWADIGTLSYDPKTSVVKGKVGFGVSPGSKRTFDARTNKWVDFPDVNYAPYAAFGGWVASVTKDTKNPECAFDYATFMGSKNISMELNVLPASGVNPSRYSHLDNVDPWVKAGFPDAANAKAYLDAIKAGYNNPNYVADWRIPGGNDYFTSMEAQLARALAKEISPQEAMTQMAKDWDDITDRLGRDKQLQYLKASLGIK